MTNTSKSPDKIPLAGVIGSPIAHSKSPRVHRHWLNKHGVKGFYIPMDVAARDLRDVLTTLPKAGFVGVNITIPHKEAVLDIADLITDRATLIGAANTLIFRKDGKIHADNTDGYGFLENLKAGAPNWIPTKGAAAVLGAGGAARAVIASLLDAGVPEILLSNRTRVRAEKLQSDFGNRIRVIDWVQAGNMLEETSLVVNTSSLGMVGKPEMRVPLDGLKKSTVVTDLVYTPLKTKLLQVAEERGCVTVDGLGMLLHQAVPGFERWFGPRPDVDDDSRAAVLR
ncbi:shikimate dehydrogenase [uncultured Roseobacter sp.]|uniref:shikimate dehydrogenase n=1 Tax=uncultured Roseobacter sp. TaxID=114847 RepID=UPI0026039E75|nr:shikimate dehydrogenase [uncultured Roseobacter sp.]